MKISLIDLPDDMKGSVCFCCDSSAAKFYDRDLGPLCEECEIHALRAYRVLMDFGFAAFTDEEAL